LCSSVDGRNKRAWALSLMFYLHCTLRSLVEHQLVLMAPPPYLFSGADFALIPSRDEPFGLVAVDKVPWVSEVDRVVLV
jgi:hypothetical protein